ncbi:MAG: chemotaxis protein CheA [Pseudomonadota bacterium]
MDPQESVKTIFFEECDELLDALETDLLKLQEGVGDAETIASIFRAVHSIKGGAGAFDLAALVDFAHAFETVLDHMRSERLEASPETVLLLLRARDLLSDHIGSAKSGVDVDADESEAILTQLVILSASVDIAPEQEASEEELEDAFNFTPVQIDLTDDEGASFEASETDVSESPTWVIEFRPFESLYRNANDPLLLLRELDRMGEYEANLTTPDLPSLEELDTNGAYIAWRIIIRTDLFEDDIREVFDFVEGECELSIQKSSSESEDKPDAALEPAPEEQDFQPVDQKPDLATAPAPSTATAKTSSAPTIRVDLERLDRLLDLVGELVINQSMLAQSVSASMSPERPGASDISIALDDLEQTTREIQDSAMAIRAQQVRIVFQRMSRVARECAAATGKKVKLVTEGEGTEVDKTVIERLAEPLTHMLRNAVDHGLEAPDIRLAAGKSEEGEVRLSASHASGRIVIQVSDDGAGIDREKILASAIRKGLIDEGAHLSDDEIDNLIFAPGFSTAAEVSSISGRGVGMDVVMRSVQDLGGRLSVSSEPGKGSAFSLSLPLTLAVLDGMAVSAGGQTFIIPLSSILESVRPTPGQTRKLGPANSVMSVRGTHVPVVDVGVALGWRAAQLAPEKGVAILVDAAMNGPTALLVDEIFGQRQYVIKSLETNYQHVDGVSAATILGDGRVALIIDVDAVIAAERRPSWDLESNEILAVAS